MTVLEAFMSAKAEPRQRKQRRTPLLIQAARWAGRHVPSWQRIRTTVLAVTGFGLIDLAAWQFSTWAGLLVAGVSLLIIEALGGDRS